MTGSSRPALRIGVLGASRIAEQAIVRPAAELGHRLVAVAARDRRRAEAFAEKYGVERVVGSYEDVLHDAEVDVVYNPLANSLHGPWNIAAARAGKPVLAEKPFAANLAQARLVAAASAAAGVPVVEAFHYRYHPVFLRFLDLITSGELGSLQRIEVTMLMPAPPDHDPRWSLAMAGGAMMDLGCYGLHVMRTVGAAFGAVPVITAARAREREPGVDAVFEAEASIGDAVGVSVNSMVADDFHFSLKATGTRAEVLAPNYIKPQEDDRLIVTTSSGKKVEHLGSRASYTYQLDAFAACVQQGVPLPVDTSDAVANMALIDAAYLAAGLAPRPS